MLWIALALCGGTACASLAAADGASGTSAGHLFQWRPFLGPFHSLVLHYPIGFLTLAVILEIYRRFRPAADLRAVIRLVIWLSLFTGLLSAALGILRAAGGGYEGHAVEIHRWFGMSVPVFTLLTLYLQQRSLRDTAGALVRQSYAAALGITLVLLVVAGHYGGNLTHGSRYLVQNAPNFVKSWLDESGADTGSQGSLDERHRQYLDVIQPLLDAKCIACHGPEKAKGKYRLDQRAFALKAGKSGHIGIKPGDPLASHVIQRVVLPATDDELMPPEGKGPLTDGEILALVRWIQAGAPYVEPPSISPAPFETSSPSNHVRP